MPVCPPAARAPSPSGFRSLWEFQCWDSIKEVLFDDLGFHSRAEKVQLGTAAMHILYYAATQLMKVGKPFILENNFNQEGNAFRRCLFCDL